MSKRYPPAKWPLPDVVDPVERLCVRVSVPNDPAHIAAFRGALLALQSAYHWQDDPAHTAREVALVWREIIRDMGTDWGCGLDSIEFRQIDDCELEYRIDGGSWQQAADFYSCAMRAINDAIAAGIIAAPGQQPAGGTIPHLECWEYNVVIRGNGRWLCPVPVSAGYTVQVESASGAWAHSNEIISNWYCPDGKLFGIGACGADQAAEVGDPLQSVNHMRLIGYTNAVYMDMYNTTYTVPVGTPTGSFFLQANDGSLDDNTGEIRCHVTVCNYSEWCYRFDFTTADGGWVATKDTNNEGGATWVNGQGWQSVYNPNRGTQHINLLRTFDAANLSYIEAEYDLVIDGETYKYHAVNCLLDDVSQYAAGLPAVNGNNLYTHTFSPEIDCDQIVWEMRQLADSTDWCYLRNVELHGSGQNPFGENNCEV